MPFAEFVASAIGVAGSWQRRYVRWFSSAAGAETPADDVFAVLRDDWTAPSFLPTTGYVVPPAAPPARIDPTIDRFPYRGLFVSAAGARTRLHLDPWTSSAVLCQVVGDKRVRMWPPVQHETMLALSLRGATGADCGVMPAYDDVLHRGEVLFIPGGWWHEVDTLSDSVAVTWNFVCAEHGSALAAFAAASPGDPELTVVRSFLSDRGFPGDDVSEQLASAMAAFAAAGESSRTGAKS
jgi:hypothetical protein